MFAAYVIVVTITIIANAYFAAADFRGSDFVQGGSEAIGVPASWFPVLGTLKAAGAAGLLAGLAGLTWLGVAAAVGLVCFFTGALIAHLRSRAFHGVGFTVAMWVAAVACLGLSVWFVRTGGPSQIS